MLLQFSTATLVAFNILDLAYQREQLSLVNPKMNLPIHFFASLAWASVSLFADMLHRYDPDSILLAKRTPNKCPLLAFWI